MDLGSLPRIWAERAPTFPLCHRWEELGPPLCAVSVAWRSPSAPIPLPAPGRGGLSGAGSGPVGGQGALGLTGYHDGGSEAAK